MDDGPEPGSPPHPPTPPRPLSRVRQVAMIAAFDLGGPLITYALLRSAGMSTVAALVISGIFPALGALGLAVWTLAYGEHEKRKAERLAASA